LDFSGVDKAVDDVPALSRAGRAVKRESSNIDEDFSSIHQWSALRGCLSVGSGSTLKWAYTLIYVLFSLDRNLFFGHCQSNLASRSVMSRNLIDDTLRLSIL